MDKRFLARQLADKLRESIGVAERELAAASDAAVNGEDAKTRREDTRMALEYGSLAAGQRKRAQQIRMALDAVESFHPARFPRDAPAALGAIVEVEDDESGDGRTFFIAPAGAGVELTGPGGDGFLTVITPVSPMGRAVMGQQVGDCFDVTVDGETRSWEITWID